jgi:hypothetical protein
MIKQLYKSEPLLCKVLIVCVIGFIVTVSTIVMSIEGVI